MKVYCPVKGKRKLLEKVNDEAFAQKMMGDGIAVIPSSGEVFSPVDGEVTMLFPTNHAIGLKSDDGIEVLVHIGIDTVELNGEGFSSYVKQGDKVEVGSPLLSFDLNKVSAQYETDIMIIITNTSAYKNIYQTEIENLSVMDELLDIE